MEVQEGLPSPFQQKLGFMKMLPFSELTLQTLIHVYPFQFLRDKDPLLRYSHIFVIGCFYCLLLLVGFSQSIPCFKNVKPFTPRERPLRCSSPMHTHTYTHWSYTDTCLGNK